MIFSERFKSFIKNNHDLINRELWDSLYDTFKYSGCAENVKKLTNLLNSIGVDPLQTMSYVPMGYLKGDKDVKELILRDNPKIKKVGQFAFNECSNLEYVEFAEGLEVIDLGAFMACSNLEQVYLPSTLKGIGNGAFNCCYSLKEVYFGGTMNEWLEVGQNQTVFSNVPARKISCIDGLVRLRK